MPQETELIPSENIERKILLVRGERVMLDADLAKLYGVPTRRLNEQVKRNRGRFPADFMFQLDPLEKDELVAICDRFKNIKHSVSLPYVFTEHGTLMLASVLFDAIRRLMAPDPGKIHQIGFRFQESENRIV